MNDKRVKSDENKVNAVWVKNFYYSRSSVQKLMFLFSFLQEESFIKILSKRIENFDFSKSEQAKNTLTEINDKFLIQATISEFSFGWVWVFESHLVYYFKNNFDFDEFYTHFSEIENSENLYWDSAEFFDKAIKILEIYKKNSFIRIYRDEEINEKTSKIKNIRNKKIKLNEKKSYFFLKKYNSKNIKLVLYFYRI